MGAVPVWRNEIGGVTWRLADSYVKTGPPHPEFQPAREAERIAWITQFDLPFQVPRVLGVGSEFLHTELIDAHPPLHPADPGAAATALGRALRIFHDSVPVEDCPFEWGPLRGDEDRVVCHGDACNPNWLLSPSLEFVGTVDLGNLGVDDRWADIAPAVQSLAWNGMEGRDAEFLRGYGIDLDEEKFTRYLLRWNDPQRSSTNASVR
ncbi:phosphotransferase [Corynebacterium sp.]|uniref:phosphotransferase n=1 Tax=Corynebacterium sp. TaxID=1720 RepID=UPI0026DF7166|nr:phosphotransferase [Corynebacterium sp.]MDO5511564.1 phosphotransferase [Corynebacterium sp.]